MKDSDSAKRTPSSASPPSSRGSLLVSQLQQRNTFPPFQELTSSGPSFFPSPEAFVLRFGQTFTSSRLTKKEKAVVASAALLAPRTPRACFNNARRLAMSDNQGQLLYTEGYMLVPGLDVPVHHGWVSLNGKVVDLTPIELEGVPGRHARQGFLPPGWAYIGVEFSPRFVCDFVAAFEGRNPCGSLLSCPEYRWPLLTGEMDLSALATSAPTATR